MNKRLVYITIAVVAVIGIVVILVAGRPDNNSFNNTTTTPAAPSANNVDESSLSEQENQTPKAGGSYIDYSDTAIADASGQRVLFFHAPWCPQCNAIEADIELQGVPEGFTIIKVDYDTNQALRQKYGVTLQTTLVKVDENGEFISKYVAYNEPTLGAIQRDFL